MWLPLANPTLGTWLATQACALTGNQTSDPLVGSQACTQSTESHQPGQQAGSEWAQVLEAQKKTALKQVCIFSPLLIPSLAKLVSFSHLKILDKHSIMFIIFKTLSPRHGQPPPLPLPTRVPNHSAVILPEPRPTCWYAREKSPGHLFFFDVFSWLTEACGAVVE